MRTKLDVTEMPANETEKTVCISSGFYAFAGYHD